MKIVKVWLAWVLVLNGVLIAVADAAEQHFRIKITGNYINLPLNDAEKPCSAKLSTEGGEPITDFKLSLTFGQPVFYGAFNVREYRGQTLTLSMEGLATGKDVAALIRQTDEPMAPDQLYREKYRPRFHYSPRVGWVNDPNGMVYYNGIYHFFYQYNPYGMKWNNMRWGYATSTDLVHWKDHGVGITPVFRGEAFSGSGAVDWKNTTGLKKGVHPPLLLFYTDAGHRDQRLVYSDDGGGSWKHYTNNPVTKAQNRDPKVVWCPASSRSGTNGPGHWIMVIFRGNNSTFDFWKSPDAIRWNKVSELVVPGHNECPDFFELSVENDPGVRKWVFLSGAGKWVQGDCAKYIVGRFDGERFTPEQESIVIDGGRENYSTQLFSDAPDNRKIFVGWYSRSFGSVGYPGMPANGQFRVPWELTLYKTQNGYRLRRLPVKELASLHGKKHGWPEQKLGAGAEFKADIESRELDIETRIEPGKSGGFDLGLAGMKVAYDASAGKVNAFGRSIDVRPVDGVLTFRILLDRTSVEMFINNGTCVMTGLFMPDDNAPAFSITATSAELLIKGLTIYEMKSMWE